MIKALIPGLILIAIGGFMVLGPVYLPRSFFGELGHGDGMGLIGMMMFGSVILLVGILVSVIGAARRSAKQKIGGDRS